MNKINFQPYNIRHFIYQFQTIIHFDYTRYAFTYSKFPIMKIYFDSLICRPRKIYGYLIYIDYITFYINLFSYYK